MAWGNRIEFRRINAVWLGFTWDTCWSNWTIDVTLLFPFGQVSIGLGPEVRNDSL